MDETSQKNNQFLDFQSPQKHSFGLSVTGSFPLGIMSSRFTHVRAWVRIPFLFKLKKNCFVLFFYNVFLYSCFGAFRVARW